MNPRSACAQADEERDYEAEIAEAKRRVQTCERALELAQVGLAEAFDRHREALQASAAERVASASDAYRGALEELERARRSFWTERRLEAWVRDFPHARKGSLPEGDVPVRGIVHEQSDKPSTWSRLRGALDAELNTSEAAEPARPPAQPLLNVPR